MKQAGIVTKATPWMMEGMGEKGMNVRYIGIKLPSDWIEIFPASNNLLLKFVIDRTSAYLEFYIANKPPFFKFSQTTFKQTDKWETLLGELKRRLKKDKTEYQNHTDSMGNLYVKIKPYLK